MEKVTRNGDSSPGGIPWHAKLSISFLAFLLCCIPVFIHLLYMHSPMGPLNSVIPYLLHVYRSAAILFLFCWLFLFVPLILLIRETSPLFKTYVLASAGCVVGSFIYIQRLGSTGTRFAPLTWIYVLLISGGGCLLYARIICNRSVTQFLRRHPAVSLILPLLLVFCATGLLLHLSPNRPEAKGIAPIDEASRDTGDSVADQGMMAYQRGDYGEAIQIWSEQLSEAEKGKNKEAIAILNNLIGAASLQSGEFSSALEHYEHARQLHIETGNRAQEQLDLIGIANAYGHAGLNPAAQEYFEKALAISSDLHDSRRRAEILVNLALIQQQTGELQKAREGLEEAIRLMRDQGNKGGEAAALSGLASLYSKLGNPTQAVQKVTDALQIHEKAGNEKGEAHCLMNLGNYLVQLNEYEQSIRAFFQALSTCKSLGDLRCQASVLSSVGAVYTLSRSYNEAIPYYEKALELDRSIGDFAGQEVCLGNLGEIRRHLDQYDRAEQLLREALDISRSTGEKSMEAVFLSTLGMVDAGAARYDDARTHLWQAIKSYEQMRASVGGAAERRGIYSNLPDTYGFLASLELQQGNVAEALEIIERGRAKSLIELLATKALSGVRPEKTGRLRELESELRRLQTKIASATNEQQWKDLELKRLDIIESIKREDPELGALVSVDPVRINDIQQLLDPDVTVAEYFHTKRITFGGERIDRLYIFLLTRDSLKVVTSDLKFELLYSKLETLLNLLRDPNSNLREVNRSSEKMYGWLIKPIRSHLRSGTLVVIPWGPMFYLPFGALRDSVPGGHGRYFVEDRSVVVAPSVQSYKYLLQKRKEGRDNIFAVGNPKTPYQPLPGAEREATEVASYFKNSILLKGDEATETRVKSEIGKPDVVHLATHGYFDPAFPDLSHVALSRDSQNDGDLELHEIYMLDWPTVSLVTLSACSSGLAQLGPGDDLASLTQGFFFAGAPSVLASLWDVDDEATRTLMVSFYKNYTSGVSTPESLRSAQRALISRTEYTHPVFWAAFELFGDWK